MKVFLSYRRSDVGGYAGRLGDTLADELGTANVFQDVTAIAPGQDFAAVIDRALDESDAVLAVIGPGWLARSTPEGVSRLLEPDDFVRLELSRALARGVPVVPVLVGDAALPDAADLPADLRGLVQRQSVELHDETWHDDVAGLLRSLRGEPAMPGRSRQHWLIAAVLVTALVIVGALWWRDSSSDRQSENDGLEPSEDDKPPCEEPTGEEWSAISLAPSPSGSVAFTDGALEFTVTEGHWRQLENGQWQVSLDIAMRNGRDQDHMIGSWFFALAVDDRREQEENCAWVAQREFVKPGRVGDARFGWQTRCKPDGNIMLEVSDADRTKDSASIEVTTADAELDDC